jgi:hypothetical protein
VQFIWKPNRRGRAGFGCHNYMLVTTSM